MIIDVIGDIHGYADKLVGLLKQLGYVHNGQYFVPPEGHRALFIGDLMDRGPQQVATLEIVFAMLDADVADAVMGNHEYNALAFATPDPDVPGEYLRSHDAVHTRQHEAFWQRCLLARRRISTGLSVFMRFRCGSRLTMPVLSMLAGM